jgi:hypothetical protein
MTFQPYLAESFMAGDPLRGGGFVILNGILLSVYRAEVTTNPSLSYWLKQGYNSASIAVNILATIKK